MRFSTLKFFLLPSILLPFAQAYKNDCAGTYHPLPKSTPRFPHNATQPLADCNRGLELIDRSAIFNDQTEFSFQSCYIKYATNGSGRKPISGAQIVNTAEYIRGNCTPSDALTDPVKEGTFWFEGNWGTGNCKKCHITMSYREWQPAYEDEPVYGGVDLYHASEKDILESPLNLPEDHLYYFDENINY